MSALVLAAPTAAAAQTFNFFNVCGYDGPLYMGCASAEAVWTGTNLQLRVWNMQGEGDPDDVSVFGSRHTITAIGLRYLGLEPPPPLSVTSWSVTYGATDVTSYWRAKADDPLSLRLAHGHKGGIVGCTDPGSGKTEHMSTCEAFPTAPYVQFSFDYASAPESPELYEFAFASTQTGGTTGSLEATATPEPMSMVLLGTGLAGLAAVRRRRKQPTQLA